MSQFTATSSFLRQIRAAHMKRAREMALAGERDRIFLTRCEAAGVAPETPDAALVAARHLLRDTPFQNASVVFTGERLWIGEGNRGNGVKHQSGFGLAAMQACVGSWEGEFAWDPNHPSLDVIISVRDWLEPAERWSWDIRRAGDGPEGQPAFW